jgi:hypothetical protein
LFRDRPTVRRLNSDITVTGTRVSALWKQNCLRLPSGCVRRRRSHHTGPKNQDQSLMPQSRQALSCALRVDLAQSKEIVKDGTLLADKVE